jgi:hypothetical protein
VEACAEVESGNGVYVEKRFFSSGKLLITDDPGYIWKPKGEAHGARREGSLKDAIMSIMV